MSAQDISNYMARLLPAGWQDAIHVETTIQFDWRDRLRILFGQTVTVRTRTLTENLPGKTETDSIRVSVFNSNQTGPQLEMGVAPEPEAPNA